MPQDPVKKAIWTKARNARNRKNGFCWCGNKRDEGYKTCTRCRIRTTSAMIKMKTIRIEAGLCPKCGTNPLSEGVKFCYGCKVINRNKQTDRRIRLISQGLCVHCGQTPHMPAHDGLTATFRFCQTCYLRKKASYYLKSTTRDGELLALLESQDWRCPYTGEIFVLGINDSIDHKMPVSKFPNLRNDISNLEWVTRVVNKSKNNMSPEEFRDFVSLVYTHCC